MSSSINPNNIDGAYPVAGQDNNSQGFRDNFTNIKTNFTFAKTEITDLQNNAVLKGALSGTTLNNNMNGSVLSNAKLQDMSETRVSLGTTSGAVTINYAAGPYYTVATSGSITVVFTNWPEASSTSVARCRLQVNVTSTAHTMTITPGGSPVSSNLVGSSNIQGMDASTGTITFSQTGTFEFEFETYNGGTTISVFDLNRNRDPMLLPSEQVFTTSGNVSLTTTTTLINSAASITGNLAAGADGQVKILAYGNVSAGNCLITVTNAGWAGNGIANLSAVGSGATFIYASNKWFCVGNNGVTFS
jgi:hypothetical protein